MHNKNVPSYLSDLLPPTNQQNNPYRLRNNHKYRIPRCRLNCYIPSAINLLIDLSIQTRNSPSTNTLKNKLRRYCDFASS